MIPGHLTTNKKRLSVLLYACATFFVIGAVIHELGLTLWPWYVSSLYSPYHDTLLAISSIAMAVFFLYGARNPDNKKLTSAIKAALLISAPLIIAMGFLVDFSSYGTEATAKGGQAVIEGVAAALVAGAIHYLQE